MITVIADTAAVRSATAFADARDTVRAFLEGLRQPAAAPDAAASVVLVVSEFVTNALRHGGHPPGLRRQDRECLPCPVASPLKQPDGGEYNLSRVEA
ncbi:hypothetical protein [Streptomyces sp. MNU76]|uniref:hypothetical protein n=1 Tax=Streptomyces sp. MNU76 TaxID=2560026 RepID=UPI0027E101D6|nr:hypothetical protein [Streptomyces sp. MNU76]